MKTYKIHKSWNSVRTKDNPTTYAGQPLEAFATDHLVDDTSVSLSQPQYGSKFISIVKNGRYTEIKIPKNAQESKSKIDSVFMRYVRQTFKGYKLEN